MSLLFMDGFDHYDDDYEASKWDASDDAIIITTGGRRNGGYLSLGPYDYLKKIIETPVNTLILGLAMKSGDSNDGAYKNIRFYNGSDIQMCVDIGAAETHLEINLGASTEIGETAVGTVSTELWHYYEFKIYVHDTNGTFDILRDGVNIFTYTGDTKSVVGSDLIDSIGFFGSTRIDDLYICDTNGTINNDFLGDVKIEAVYPDADGIHTDFTCSIGTDHYALVDENPLSETDYNEGDTVGNKDSYGITTDASVADDTILAIQVVHALNNPDAGEMNAKGLVRSNSIDYLETNPVVVNTTMKLHTDIRETDPQDSAAWTKAKLDAAEFGIEIVS